MRERFHSVGAGGLRQDLLPVRLYGLAKRWFWDPAAIDFTQDVADWQRMTALERDVILRLTSLFQAGEEAVTLDLLPLIGVIAREGRLEEEMYLTSFLFEEAKHVEFFRRFLDAIGVQEDLHRYHTDHYRQIFCHELPAAMERLHIDPSPAAQLEAAVTYNIIVEGLLAETGYHAYASTLEVTGVMPGLCRGIRLVQKDESRHIAWGIYHCGRLVAADPSLMGLLHSKAATLAVPALGIIQDLFAAYKVLPFGLRAEDFVDYAMDQFQRRMAALERMAEKTADQVGHMEAADLGVEF